MRALAALEVRLERELLRRTVNGDTAALVDLFDRLAPAAYGMACRVMGDETAHTMLGHLGADHPEAGGEDARDQTAVGEG